MMSEPERIDFLVLGSGEAGKFLAWHMAKAGHRSVVVERKLIGGSSPTPTACPARTKSGAPKSPIWCAMPNGSEY
jgi:glycine/D-amino acid oxidase-like deaminating enzyme